MKGGDNMIPVNFKEANTTFVGPEGSGIKPLPVYKDPDQIISQWKGSLKDRLTFLFTGRLWLGVTGPTQPPVFLAIGKLFEKTQKKAEK